MADDPSDQEKTEAPTERRLEKAFEEGSIQQPQDFHALAAVVMLLAALPLWQVIVGTIGEMHRRGFAALLGLGAGFGLAPGADLGAVSRLPLLSISIFFVAALAVGFAQQRFRLTVRPLRATFANLLPSKGLTRVFGLSGLSHSGASALKLTAALALLGALLLPLLGPDFLRADIWTHETAVALAKHVAVPFAVAVLVLLALFSLADLLLKRTLTRRQLRMSRHEMKEEMKETEGNPEIKSRLRQLRRQRRGTSRKHPLKTADVVLTNPTHYAVALAWYPGGGRAPMVIGKGAGLFARRLRLLAWAAGIPILREPALTRSIFRTTDIDAEVPEALYADVARILVHIYRLHGKPLPG